MLGFRNVVRIDELVDGLLNGRRIFTGFELHRDSYHALTDHPRYHDLLEYLRSRRLEDYRQNPIELNGSSLRYVDLRRIHMPYAAACAVDLSGSDLRGANISNGVFSHADLSLTRLEGLDVEGTDFNRAYFIEADLTGVRNLDKALNLGSAVFHKARMTTKEAAIVTAALREQNRNLGIVFL